MPNFFERPGFLFVLATVLPLVSFLLIFLASGVWCIARRYRTAPGMEGLYQLFGGDKPGKTPAFLALAAIAVAFVLSMTGFVLHYRDLLKYHHAREPIEEEIKHRKDFQIKLALDKAAREKVAEEIEAKEDALAEVDKDWERQRAEKYKGTLF